MSQPAAHADPEPGTVVAERYRIIGLLGRGGMGAVYRVEHVKLKKEMALKLLRPEISKLDDVAKRFEREAEAAARLDHPNIISVTDFGSTDAGQLFLVMELLNGPSLAKMLLKDGAMPAPRALHIIRQVLSALQRAHSAGVVHRDLKPDNIVLVEREGERDVVKLLDFGIAKLVASDGAGEQLTRAGAIFGTPQYFSPEQAMGEPVDARADLYAAGVMMYEMLTGQRPFEAQSVVELISMHVTRDPAPVSQLAPHIQPALSEAVARAMNKRRADRFPDASAMWQALQAGAGVVPPVGLSGAFLSPQGTPPIVQPPPGGARTAPLPAVTAPPAFAPTMPSASASNNPSGAPGLALPPWLTRKVLIGIAVAVGVLLGLIIFAATRGGPTTFAAAVEQKARAGEIIDRLQNGRTCRERKVAALELIALDDPRYLEVLRGARDRRGGWFGLQAANGCVARELDAAIRKLEAQK
jgi:eukaryotic-like serine/threonine-protein kinase